ncbi:MAG: hypothetical protein A2Y15_04010 [Clostridiales bacterium GWF2_36_10]|nr:MAG: hypothetical protein A2Y15_04010 [Clostridiales bacterium GWF2_36_10]
MKTLIIIKSFIRKNIFPIIIITLTMTVILFILVTVFGKLQYITQARDIYEQADLKNSVYFEKSFNIGEDFTTANKKVEQSLKNYSAFESFLNTEHSLDEYSSFPVNKRYYSNELIIKMPLRLISGEWFSDSSGQFDAVIGGVIWGGVKVGDKITLESGLTVNIIGIMDSSAVSPSMNSGGSTITVRDIFKLSENILILNKSKLPAEYMSKNSSSICSIITYKDNATDSEKHKMMEYLSTEGITTEYNVILENTNKDIKQEISKMLPIPLFLMIISTISMICICTLSIKKSMSEHSVYFLNGCSKRRSVIIISSAIMTIFTIPCLINIILALFFPAFLRYNPARTMDIIVDFNCVIPLLIYTIAVLLITSLIPILFYRKYSPLDFYRRNL